MSDLGWRGERPASLSGEDGRVLFSSSGARRFGRARTAMTGAVAVALLLSGCASSPPGRSIFPTDTGVDYQLGGASDVPAGVGIVARDSTARPAPGVYSICYINGFQTQPGEEARWAGRSADLLLRDAAGDPVYDPGWPDEAILDTSSPEKRIRIADELSVDIDRCADSGFDAVEIDNLDSYTRASDRLDVDGAVALARLYADRAHARGLAIGQKNAADEVDRMKRDVGFDFAVTEECVEFSECDRYTEIYGGAVVDIEYIDDIPDAGRNDAVARICAASARPASLVIRDRDLSTPGTEGYFRASC